MKQRIIASAVVFVVGFGIGLGVTYALLAKKPSETPEMADAGYPGDLADEPVAEPAPAVAAAARPAADQAPAEPAPTEETPAEEEAPTEEAPAIEAPAEEEAPVEEAQPAEEQPGDVQAEEAAPDEEQPAEATADGPWWKGLAGSKARVDLGRARALTIRKGSLEDGEVLDWSRFGRNPRIGVLFAEDQNVVTVHGVAVNAAGTPVAAEITLDKQGRETTGIIALHTQGLEVTLYPVSGNTVDGEMATP